MCSSARPGIREIAYDSPAYHEVLGARDRILRQPLGLRLSEDDVRHEKIERHFVLEAGGRILGGVIARAAAPRSVRLRQMWIEPDRQGLGLGRELLGGVVARLEGEGIREIVLHAREPVVDFYRHCGFAVEGGGFTEIGIPHRRMTLALNPEKRSPDGRR